MATERLEIQLIGKDGISRSFTAISKSATQMGTDIERAGTRGNKSLAGLKQNSTQIGAAFGVMGAAVSLSGRAFVDQERQIRGLERSYGAATDEILAFSEGMQQSTVYSNDAARQSAQIASTLAQNYGFTADEIQKVITISADLAAVTGYELADATQRVTAALRGEAESAEMLGLTMNQAAIDRQGLTLTMTNQEAAQFRLNVLTKQSAFAEGAAGDMAETTAGKTRQLVNAMQDATQGFGGFLGPVAESTAVLGNFALALPLVTGNLGKLAGGIRGVGALGAMFGPLGLAAGAAALGIGGLIVAIKKLDENADDAWNGPLGQSREQFDEWGLQWKGAARDVDEFLRTFNATGATVDGQVRALSDSYDTWIGLSRDGLDEVLRLTAGMELNGNTSSRVAQIIETVAQAERDLGVEIAANIDMNRYALAAIDAKTYAWNEQFRLLSGAANQYGPLIAAEKEIAAIRARPLYAAASAEAGRGLTLQTDQMALFKEQSAAIRASLVAWVGESGNIINLLSEMGDGWIDVANSVNDASSAMDGALAVFGGIDALGARSEAALGIVDKLFGPDGNAFDGVGPLRDQLDQLRISQDEFNAAVGAGTSIQATNTEVQADLNTIRAQQLPLLAEQAAAYERSIDALTELSPAQQQLALAMQDTGIQAQVATAYSTALSASMGELGRDGEEAATKLITGMTEADPVLKALLVDLGLISETDGEIKVNFPDADQTTLAITNLTDSIDALILTMGGIVPPRIEIDDQASGPLDALIEKFAAFNTAANEAAVDKFIGLGGGASQFPSAPGSQYAVQGDPGPVIPKWSVDQPVQTVFTWDITDPVAKKQVMEEFIAEFAFATWEAEFSGNDTHLQAVVERALPLAESMGDIQTTTHFGAEAEEFLAVFGSASILADSIDGRRVLTHVDGEATGAIGAVQSADGSLRGIDGRTASTSILGYDYTGGAVNSAHGNLNSIDGRTATTYIDTIYRQSGATAFAHGGTIWADKDPPNIPRAQQGRTVLVGEAGPELVNLPFGSRVTPHGASMSQLAGGGGGDVHLNVYGNVYGVDDLMSIVTDRLVPVLVSAADNHTRGLGSR